MRKLLLGIFIILLPWQTSGAVIRLPFDDPPADGGPTQMADRYWVGNAGNTNDTAHWSATSGGSGGASVPTASDNCYFNPSSFTLSGQTVTVNAALSCLSMDWTGVTNSPTLNGNNTLVTIDQDLTLVSAMTVSSNFKLRVRVDGGGSSPFLLNFAGKTIAFAQWDMTPDGASAVNQVKLMSNVRVDANININLKTQFNSNGYTLDVPDATTYHPNLAAATGSRFILGASVIDIGYGTFGASNGLVTITSGDEGTSTIKAGSIVTGATGTQYFNDVVLQPPPDNSTVSFGDALASAAQGAVINNMTILPGTASRQVNFINTVTIGNKTYVFNGALVANGSPGNYISIRQSTVNTHKINFARPVATSTSLNYVDLKNIVGQHFWTVPGPESYWYAYNSLDNGGDTGWTFSPFVKGIGALGGSMYMRTTIVAY